MQKQIIWNNKKWIIDYKTGTIYQKAVTHGLPVQARFGDYYLENFRGILYFTTGDRFYKIIDEEVLEISKDEYEQIRNYRTLNKKDPVTLRNISTYVTSVIIDDVMSRKFDLKISFPVEPPHVVNRFSKKFNPEIANQIQKITTAIVATLPSEIDRRNMKQQINTVYKSITQEDNEFIKTLIDNIYLNDKESFDYLAESVLNSNNSRNHKVGTSHNVQLEKATGQKGKLK